MKKLHERYGDRVRFIDVAIRQAHPGERRGPYRSYAEKLEGAREGKREEDIPWPVLVDDYAGSVHHAYRCPRRRGSPCSGACWRLPRLS